MALRESSASPAAAWRNAACTGSAGWCVAGLPSSRGGGVGVAEAESPSEPEEDSSSVRHSGVESDQPPSVGGVEADVDELSEDAGDDPSELDQCSRISPVKGPGHRVSPAASNAAIVPTAGTWRHLSLTQVPR